MELLVQPGDITQVECDILIVNLFEGVTSPGGATGAVDSALGGWLSELIMQERFKGKLNTTLDIPTFGKIPARRVVVVGLGKPDEFTVDRIRQAAATGVKRAKALNAGTVATLLHGAGIAGQPAEICARALTEGTLLGAYEFTKYKTPPRDEQKVIISQVIVIELDEQKIPAIERGMHLGGITAGAAIMARDLANEPPDLLTPLYLAQTAEELAKDFGLEAEIWDEQRIAQEGMNCLAMVGRGSAHPPRFIQLTYTPKEKPHAKICIIGKGLCYDSGGLSLKPSDAMRHMKSDMSGAAVVLGVMRAIAQLQPCVAVTGFIPACENMIDGTAYKVDDILRARNGKTIEVDNTDAEGRLVLADALSFAAEADFDAVVDIATLTGGCVIALGRIWTAVMGNDQPLIDKLIAAGDEVGERMWMLPFDSEMREMLDSDIADIKNSGGREGSSIQGGMFLQEFAGEMKWAHLDIAGTSFLDKPRAYEPKHATGVPARALIEFIMGM